MYDHPERIQVVVKQKPYAVGIQCPHCEHDMEFDYDDFCAIHGDPPDWYTETVTCPECGAEMTIDDQEWD